MSGVKAAGALEAWETGTTALGWEALEQEDGEGGWLVAAVGPEEVAVRVVAVVTGWS